MSYQHISTEVLQEPKRPGDPCGDATWVGRSAYHTSLVLADGIGCVDLREPGVVVTSNRAKPPVAS